MSISKRFFPAFFFSVLLAFPLTAQSSGGVEVRHEAQRYLLGNATRIDVNLPFGDLRVEGYEGDEVEIEFGVTCRRQNVDKCRRPAERIRVVPRIHGDRFVIGLRNTPRGRIEGVAATMSLRLPRHVALDVDLTSGDVFVTRMDSDVSVAGSIGDVDVVARQGQAGTVNVSVVAGQAELWLDDGHLLGSGFPRAIRWRGSGSATIRVKLGTGDARVRLE